MKKWEIKRNYQDYDKEYQFFDYDIINKYWKKFYIYIFYHFQWYKNNDDDYFNENIDQQFVEMI